MKTTTMRHDELAQEQSGGAGPACNLPGGGDGRLADIPWRPYYAKLNEEERHLYRQIADGLRLRERSIGLDAFPIERTRFFELVDAVRREVGDIGVTPLTVVWQTGGAGDPIPLRLEGEYGVDADTAAAWASETERIARKAAAAARAHGRGRDHLIALYLHDWLIERCRYDNGNPQSHEAVGALVLQRAVCDGIARAYKLLCDHAGVACALITGTDGHGKGHAWNVVRADGRWAHVDVTNDLPDCQDADTADSRTTTALPETGKPSRAYFGLSDAQVRQNRSIDPDSDMPACPQGFGYFESRGLVAGDADALAAVARRALASRGCKEFEVKLVGSLAYGANPTGGKPAVQQAVREALVRCGVHGWSMALQGMDVVRIGVMDEDAAL